MSAPAENFLDQLITWREVGYNFCAHREDYDRYESLPSWAQKTLLEHATDERPNVYALDEFEAAAEAMPRSGMPRKASSFARVTFTIICACCGAKRFWNGPPHHAKPFPF
jgi:hypothetical protein